MKILNMIEDLVITVGLVLMGAALALQIFMRYVLNFPLIWSEEFARYMFVWVAFIGAGYGVRHNIHISLELFYNKMPKAVQKAVSIASNVLAFCVFAYLVPVGLAFTVDQSTIASSAMQIPMSYVVVAVPVGCVIVCLRLALQTAALLQGKGE